MDSDISKRKLAAILAADVVGYSRLMEDDEEGTLRELNTRLAVFQRLVPEHAGRIFGGAGDSVIAEFPSAVQALSCALKIQDEIAADNTRPDASGNIRFRIGISLGDVIIEGDNLMGQGVNIAARIESLAEPGGINISNDVYRQVRNKLPADYRDIGLQHLKNIAEPVRVYQVTTAGCQAHGSVPLARRAGRRGLLAIATAVVIVLVVFTLWPRQPAEIPLPPEPETASRPAGILQQPGIAVLPLINMNNDPAQEYFSDGMTDDLITDLTKVSGIFVIARDSTFYYKGETENIRKIAQDLGVRYVLHGSIRRAGAAVRVNLNLTDAGSGRQIWAERYDGDMTNVFGLQDEITQQVVSALAIKLTQDERKKLARRQTNNLQAYETFLKAQELATQYSKDNNRAAQKYLQQAIDLDPEFPMAYALLGWSHVFDAMNGWVARREDSLGRAAAIADKAIALDNELPLAYFVKGLVHREKGEYIKALAEAEKSIALDRNYANGHVLVATLLYYAGRPAEGLERIKVAMRLNPHHPHNYPFHLGQAYFILRRYDEAIAAFKQGLQSSPSSERLHVWLAAAYAQAGRVPEARWEMDIVRDVNPSFSLARMREAFPFQAQADLDHFLEGLRKAGASE